MLSSDIDFESVRIITVQKNHFVYFSNMFLNHYRKTINYLLKMLRLLSLAQSLTILLLRHPPFKLSTLVLSLMKLIKFFREIPLRKNRLKTTRKNVIGTSLLPKINLSPPLPPSMLLPPPLTLL